MTKNRFIQRKVEEFKNKFTDKWSNGVAVVYPVKEGVAEIIPVEDFIPFLRQALEDMAEFSFNEAVGQFTKLDKAVKAVDIKLKKNG